MNTTTIKEENMLIKLDGTYNQEIHSQLNKIIDNIASKYKATNPTLSIEDLKQNAWLKIFETIERNKKPDVRTIQYLVMVAKNAILAECMDESKIRDNIDDFSSMIMSSTDDAEGERHNQLNVAKMKLEYDILKNKINEEEATTLRVAFENVINSIQDDVVKNFIIIKYIKEFNGESKTIYALYNNFYNSLDENRRSLLDDMDKFTNNLAFKALGMRATDKYSTVVRAKVKEVLFDLYTLI